jgi:hypothetical protein
MGRRRDLQPSERMQITARRCRDNPTGGSRWCRKAEADRGTSNSRRRDGPRRRGSATNTQEAVTKAEEASRAAERQEEAAEWELQQAQQGTTSVAGVYDVAFDRQGQSCGHRQVRGLVLPASAGFVPSALLLGPPAPSEALGVCRPVCFRGAGRAALVLVEVFQAVLEDSRLVSRAVAEHYGVGATGVLVGAPGRGQEGLHGPCLGRAA